MTDHDLFVIGADSVPLDQLPAPPAAPVVDQGSRLLLDRHDAAAQLHVLTSLQADSKARRPASSPAHAPRTTTGFRSPPASEPIQPPSGK